MNSPWTIEEELSLYNDTLCRSTGQYFCNSRPFSTPRAGNKVSLLSSGKDVLKSIHAAMMTAEHFIWIADWQMGFDVELVRRGGNDHSGQLHKVIEQIIKTKKVQIRILLYCSVVDSAPPYVYDTMVADKLNGLNRRHYPGSVKVLQQLRTSGQIDKADYSHHQKFVVVDGGVGFIGGIDLSYGRWDTAEFDVVVDPRQRLINEMYSPGMAKLRPPSLSETKIIGEHDCAAPYGGKLIEEGCQPRMPWQDVHIQIEGPSVVDIHRNFVRRWNLMSKHPSSRRTLPHGEVLDQQWLENANAWHILKARQQLKEGGAQVQIVRSVSSSHLKGEGGLPDDLMLYSVARERDTWHRGLRAWCGQHQNNILNAMVNCIKAANNYVYIETQFFVSAFGNWGEKTSSNAGRGTVGTVVPQWSSAQMGNEDNGIKNEILDALAARISHHINASTPFHVYMVIPVHPEGMLTDGSVWKQQWLALVSIKHGSTSLIERIKKSLRAKKRDPNEWVKFLTVLNMRNHGATVQYARDPETFDEDFSHEIGRFIVTEQIYIHSKLLIVDDAVAIVGSANINDRSLTGNGDTEIAAVVVDTEGIELRDLGSPTFKVQTRKFARDLRRQLWEKHFGFMLHSVDDRDTSYFKSTIRATRASHSSARLEHPPRVTTTRQRILDIGLVSWDEILDKPCALNVVQAIQRIAAHNAMIYERVFLHTPRDSMTKFEASVGFHTLPYAALYDSQGTKYLRAGSIPPTEFSFAPMTAEQRTAFNEKRLDALQKNEDAAGQNEKFAGVVPPALAAEFMTTKLTAHQKSALKEPTYGRLQQLYAGGTVHDIDKTLIFLKGSVVGFFVSMPLDWGMGTTIKGNPGKHSTVDICAAPSAPRTEG